MTQWNNFNDAEQQQGFDLIPKGTLVKLRMTIKPGAFDNLEMGWTGGWASESFDTGAVFLACEGIVLDGPYAKRKLWWNVGLHSAKGPTWANMGRTFIRAALNSARNVHPQDTTQGALAARCIRDFGDLNGLEFVARIDIEKDAKGGDRNTIRNPVEPDHRDYVRLMGLPAPSSPVATSAPPAHPTQSPTPAASNPAARPSAPSGKPAWAQ
jgi:hypothetical protein